MYNLRRAVPIILRYTAPKVVLLLFFFSLSFPSHCVQSRLWLCCAVCVVPISEVPTPRARAMPSVFNDNLDRITQLAIDEPQCIEYGKF